MKARPRFRLIKGGLAGAGVGGIATRTRKHPAATAAVGVAAAATAIGAVMLYGAGDTSRPPEHRPPLAGAPSMHPHVPRLPQATHPPHSHHRPSSPAPSRAAGAVPPGLLFPVSSKTTPTPAGTTPTVPGAPTSSPTTPPTGPTPPPTGPPTSPPGTPTPPITQPTSAPPGLCLNLSLPPLATVNVCL
jgi:hypothetical protein